MECVPVDPYGVAVITAGGGGTGSVQNPFLFAGGIQDRATGWVHFGARWYNPTTGRWTQQDTLDAPLDPSNANRYAYAGDDPTNNVDPQGAGILNDVAGGLVGLATSIACEALTLGIGTLGCFAIGLVAGLAYTYTLNY